VQSSPLYIGGTKPSPATKSSSCTFHHRQGHSPTETPTGDWSAVAHLSNTILSLLCTSLLHLPLPLQVYNIFITQKMRAIAHEQFTCACKCILPLFDYDGYIWGAYQTSGDSWPLGGISTNLYLPCLCHHGGMPSFLLACRTCILRTLLSCWSFLFSKLWSHCSYCKHDLHENHGAL